MAKERTPAEKKASSGQKLSFKNVQLISLVGDDGVFARR